MKTRTNTGSQAAPRVPGVEKLLEEHPRSQRRGGPVGKAQRLFEAVSRLPRHQQEKICAVLEPYVAQYVRNLAGEE